MNGNLAPMLFASAAGGMAFMQEAPIGVSEIFEKGGMAGIAFALVFWMMTSFNKKIDRLTAAVEKLAEKSG